MCGASSRNIPDGQSEEISTALLHKSDVAVYYAIVIAHVILMGNRTCTLGGGSVTYGMSAERRGRETKRWAWPMGRLRRP